MLSDVSLRAIPRNGGHFSPAADVIHSGAQGVRNEACASCDRSDDVGDPSQVDLPSGQTSGLAEAVRLLDGIEGVGHVAFTHEDVIRHELVARIVEAYDRSSPAREGKG